MFPFELDEPIEYGRPPQEMRFVDLQVEPWKENPRRVRVHLEVTPFQNRPNLTILIHEAGGREVASIYIIETIERKMSFTMHLRGEEIAQPLTLSASLEYPEIEPVDQRRIEFNLS
jgi:hypothetical protein